MTDLKLIDDLNKARSVLISISKMATSKGLVEKANIIGSYAVAVRKAIYLLDNQSNDHCDSSVEENPNGETTITYSGKYYEENKHRINKNTVNSIEMQIALIRHILNDDTFIPEHIILTVSCGIIVNVQLVHPEIEPFKSRSTIGRLGNHDIS